MTSKGTWVAPEDRDTVYYLFHKLFAIRVNDLARRSIGHIAQHGVMVTRNKEYDQNASKQLIMCMVPIVEMAKYHANGVAVYLVDPKDAKEIYEIVHKHVETWVNYLNEQFGVGDAPVDDLIILDEFASRVYPSAHRFFPNGKVEDAFTKAVGGVTKFFKGVNFKTDPVVQNDDDEEQNKPKREGFGDVLGEYKDIKDFRWR